MAYGQVGGQFEVQESLVIVYGGVGWAVQLATLADGMVRDSFLS